MTRFEPFAGLRYNDALVSLDDVIAPPYDVVSPRQRATLAARSPFNAIRVELPDDADGHGGDRYAYAAQEFVSWQDRGALQRESEASFYVYRMTFRSATGTRRSTTGVIGALQLDSSGSWVLPHERTMPKPKGDRLDLLRACCANLSPIWGLSLSQGLSKSYSPVVNAGPPDASATDDDGNLHELWVIGDETLNKEISSVIGATPVVIADGHHRYETALFYQAEQHAKDPTGDESSDFVLAFIVELSDDELLVRAIHRLVAGLPVNFNFEAAFSSYFDILPAPEDKDDLEKAMFEIGALGLVTPSGAKLLKPLDRVVTEAEADLDSSRLDVALASTPAHQVTYQHGASNIFAAVADRTAQAGILLRPATVDQIAETAHSGRRMPPKTTFFHPKPRTGMVYRTL